MLTTEKSIDTLKEKREYRERYSFFLFLLVIIMGNTTVFGFSSGPPAERTGNPGETCDGDTCASSCHTSFSVNSGTAKFLINLSSSQYKSGQTLDVTIAFDNVSTAIHGFEITAVDASNKKIGSFTSKDETTQSEVYDSLYAAHTKIGTAENQWTVQWTAPAAKVSDPVTFYAAGNEANGNSSGSGDYIYTGTATLFLAEDCIPSQVMVKPKKLFMKRGARRNITVTVESKGHEFCSNYTVSTHVAKKKITIEDGIKTDENGKAAFTVVAGDTAGKDVITFSVQENDRVLTKKVKVKIQ